MNEQLIVKNFGPIKDATVDFKRVTVFIGPTGGGKSTLAKLAAIMRDKPFYTDSVINPKTFPTTYPVDFSKRPVFDTYSLSKHFNEKTELSFTSKSVRVQYSDSKDNISLIGNSGKDAREFINYILNKFSQLNQSLTNKENENILKREANRILELMASEKSFANYAVQNRIEYIPTERIFLPAIEYSWAGLMRDDIGLPKILLNFANSFSLSRKEVNELDISFLNVKYIHSEGKDFIKIPEHDELLKLLETASGIQSVIPLLVLLEYLSRNIKQTQSFIIEEPELNLFPLAQFELVKILVEKCAQADGKNDLVLTTHSPYVLTALNLLCYAHRIAQQDEATAKKVAKLIPRRCWIDPDQFAAYYVDRPDTKRKQQVRSIINKKTGLIEENELDTASEELGSIFDKLLKLRKPTSTPTRAN